MSGKETKPGQEPGQQRPVDLKYGQTVVEAGEYKCSSCGASIIFRKNEVAKPCRSCKGHFYYALFHLRR